MKFNGPYKNYLTDYKFHDVVSISILPFSVNDGGKNRAYYKEGEGWGLVDGNVKYNRFVCQYDQGKLVTYPDKLIRCTFSQSKKAA